MNKKKAAFSGSLAHGGSQGNFSTEVAVQSTDNARQRQYVLACLRQCPHSTLDFRNKGIMHPAGRVRELRGMGFNIPMTWRHEPDNTGLIHRTGIYTLLPKKTEVQP